MKLQEFTTGVIGIKQNEKYRHTTKLRKLIYKAKKSSSWPIIKCDCNESFHISSCSVNIWHSPTVMQSRVFVVKSTLQYLHFGYIITETLFQESMIMTPWRFLVRAAQMLSAISLVTFMLLSRFHSFFLLVDANYCPQFSQYSYLARSCKKVKREINFHLPITGQRGPYLSTRRQPCACWFCFKHCPGRSFL